MKNLIQNLLQPTQFAVFALALFMSNSVYAQRHANQLPAQSREEFCQLKNNPDFFKDLLYYRENLLSFISSNKLGIAGSGVCWWHSMYQRSATYLMVFRPDLAKPSYGEAQDLIQDIIAQRGVVEVPGFHNLREFSTAYEKEFMNAIEGWQIGDGGFLFGWIRGMMGDTDVPSSELKIMMDDLYDRVMNKKQVTYQMLQIPGIAAHAWLVVDMEKIENGYRIYVLDSLIPKIYPINYFEGMTRFVHPEKKSLSFVPYTSRNGILSTYESLQNDYCKNGKTSVDYRPKNGPF